ncbi:hypothetical protein [Paludibacterium purpuratum]|uniref:Uncharacterized protein n=1 Tax=Paludibacterium purpuratum TaxID=1144873 RepID=A0A4R7BF09_9NEIS|nr:hypothetical protein [Paludibacterium purpuratum]TDR82267.1 hypothetical protein DFP86_102384 [Paludibacterium purpuratum]
MKALWRRHAYWPTNSILVVGLVSLWSVAPVHAGEFGELSAAGQAVLNVLKRHSPAYFNLAQTDPRRAAMAAFDSLQRGEIVILDATQAHDASLTDQVAVRLSGLRTGKPMAVAIRNADGSINMYVADYGAHVGMAQRLKRERAQARRAKRDTAPTQAAPALVGKTVHLSIAHLGLSCVYPGRFERKIFFGAREWKAHFDACAGRASYATKVRFDFFSSNSRGAQGHLPPGRLLRISQGLGNAGGSGWHLVDALRNEDWDHDGSNMWIGPFINEYGVAISLDNDRDVSLIEHEPKNVARGLEVEVVRSDMRQRSATASLTLGGSPGVTLGGEGGDSQTTSSTLKYKLNEYETFNSTAGNRFKLAWRLMLSEEQMHGRDASALAGKPRLSGMSHGNFAPGYLVTYQAPFDKQGESTVSIESYADTVAWISKKRLGGDYETYGSGAELRFTDTLRVDWQSPFFLPEPTVMLKAYRHDSLHCLALVGAGLPVRPEACDGAKRQQTWMQRNLNQIVSVASPGLCLAGWRDGRLTAESCQPNGFQEWRWEGTDKDRLTNVATRRQVGLDSEGAAAMSFDTAACDSGDEMGRCAWRAYESMR